MKKVMKNFIMVAVLLLFTTACAQSLTKEGYIQKYQSWITFLEENYLNYQDADWIRAEADFKLYSETEYNRFKDDFSPEERVQVDQLTGQYYAILAKHKARQLNEQLKTMINNVHGILNELNKP
jgi:hypothetical protein